MTYPFDPFVEEIGRDVTDEQRRAWQEYQAQGGRQSLYDWIDSGMPAAAEEQAASAWMDRLFSYLEQQYNSGLISESEANVILSDMAGRLSGSGKYAGKRQTTMDLPSTIRSDVERYTEQIATEPARLAEQRRQEQEAKVRQAAQLPLGAGGNITQQIAAGRTAIRNLQGQLTYAPDYLQDTIRGQIATLQRDVNQLWQTEKSRAGERAQVAGLIEEPAPEIDYGTMTREFAARYDMSPQAALQTGMRYQANPEAPEFAGLSLEEKGDLAWVGMEYAQGAATRSRPEPYEPPGYKEIEPEVSGPPLWKSWFAQTYPSIAWEFGEKPIEQRTEETWAAFLEKEREKLRTEFAKQSPYRRGERPSAYQPKIKTVGF